MSRELKRKGSLQKIRSNMFWILVDMDCTKWFSHPNSSKIFDLDTLSWARGAIALN